MGTRWRVVHPDGVAEISSGGATRWMFFEIDRGTAELQRYRLKLRRYARFFLSGTWRARYASFPQVRIVTAHRPRVRRMLAVIEDALRVFSGRERDAPGGRSGRGGRLGARVPGGSEQRRVGAHVRRGRSRADAAATSRW